LARADTIVVPGIEDTTVPIPQSVFAALQNAWDRGARVTSICTGAFVLAASGLLDGKRATTHWLLAAQLARAYPRITVEPDVLFVDEGRIVTSAGASSGLDMCLHLVRRDYGQAVAARAARLAVAPLSRDGGQAQFIRQDPPGSPSSLAPLIDWAANNLSKSHSVHSLAARARMSPRTFARRFREQTGTTPLQWLVAARVQRAQQLLEESKASVEQVATRAGFESPVTFRARFRRAVGLTPSEYRRRFTA
jgi:transcriptional regulator GlxA family with amidase domain